MHHESKKADFIVYRSHNWSFSREEQLQARSDTSSLAQRHHFIPDLLAFRAQTPAPKTPETPAAQPQAPASEQPASTLSQPELAVAPNHDAATATEPAQE